VLEAINALQAGHFPEELEALANLQEQLYGFQGLKGVDPCDGYASFGNTGCANVILRNMVLLLQIMNGMLEG